MEVTEVLSSAQYQPLSSYPTPGPLSTECHI